VAVNTVEINGLIRFSMGDTEMERFLRVLQQDARLIMDCSQCGTTLVPQCRSHHAHTKETEFRVSCVSCGRSHTVRMYGSYGFILPTDDEFYRSAEGVIL